MIDNLTITAGQAYEAMSNAGYLDSNMIVILNDSRHSLHPNMEEGSKATISALSSIMSKIQSSQIFRKFRELAKVCICYTLSMKLSCLQWLETSVQLLLVLIFLFLLWILAGYDEKNRKGNV